MTNLRDGLFKTAQRIRCIESGSINSNLIPDSTHPFSSLTANPHKTQKERKKAKVRHRYPLSCSTFWIMCVGRYRLIGRITTAGEE